MILLLQSEELFYTPPFTVNTVDGRASQFKIVGKEINDVTDFRIDCSCQPKSFRISICRSPVAQSVRQTGYVALQEEAPSDHSTLIWINGLPVVTGI